MDLTESIAPDSSLEIVEDTNERTRPYDEFIDDEDESSAESQGSLIYYINDDAADSILSSSSWNF